MPKYLFFLCLFFFTILFHSHAQQVETRTNYDQLLSSEVLKLSLTVKNRRAPELPVFPEIHGFRKGRTTFPQTSRGSRRSYAYSQIYYPHIAGAFDIPAIPISVNGKQIFTKALKSEVIVDEEIAAGFQEEEFPCKMLLITDSQTFFVGQAFQLQVALEVKKRDLQKLSIPDLSFFQKELLAQVDQSVFEVISVPSKELQNFAYTHQDIDKEHLILGSMFLLPKRSGTLAMPQFSLSLRKRWIKRTASKKEKENEQHVRYYLSSFETEPSTLEVLELPPTDLHLAEIIGDFTIDYSLNKESYLCGESIKLMIHIDGSGNLRAIPRPLLKVPEGFLQYDPVSSIEIIPDLTELRGRKTFMYELIAAKPGDFVIPPESIYFFNSHTQAYDSTRLDSIHLSIRGEAIPQLLEINILHNFYRDALSNSTQTPSYSLPHEEKIIMGFSLLAICLLILSLFSPGKRIFKRKNSKTILSPGLKRLVENKKG